MNLRCVAEVKDYNNKYSWRMMSCQANIPYVCERDPLTPPEPVTCGPGFEMVDDMCLGFRKAFFSTIIHRFL